MARKISVIKQQIIDAKDAEPSLDSLNSPSQTAIWNLWAFIQAVCINLFEQILDIFKTEIEGKILGAGIGNDFWLRAQVLKFQYSATTPQFVELDTTTFELKYAVIDSDLQILTRAGIVSLSGPVTIKVAKSEPPEPLSPTEVTALEAYVKEIQFSGKQINILSENPDSLIVIGAVYYNGQFSSTISDMVIAALDAYCASLSSVDRFGSLVRLTDVEAAILAVEGVTDIDLEEVSVRPDGEAIGSRYKIYDLSEGTNNRQFAMVSGYIIQEVTASYTFADTLTFIAE